MPVTDLAQAILLHRRQIVWFGDDICGRHRPVQRTGVNGSNVVLCQPCCKSFRLGASLIREKDIRGAGETILHRKLCCTMPNEVETGCHSWFASVNEWFLECT